MVRFAATSQHDLEDADSTLHRYDPDAVTTKDGKLEITLTQEPTHGLNFRSGMLQSWNKMCFSGGGYIEVSMSMPGTPKAMGYWPGAWTMGMSAGEEWETAC
jgi:beta-glucanase (GH16 family)